MNTVYLNGDFTALEDAKISVLDRGFLFSDAIYEVIPVYGGQLFRFEEHIQRLNYSLQAIQLPLQMTTKAWQELCEQLLEHNKADNVAIYLQISRGTYLQRSHDFPTEVEPTILLFLCPLPGLVENVQDIDFDDFSVITSEDIRWHRCDIKSTSLLANCLLKQQALEKNAQDTILVRDGLVTEATSSNVFMVKEGCIYTPKLDHNLLSGVTRDFVIQLADKANIPLQESSLTVSQLEQADEIWLTSSTKEIRPVTHLNDAIIADGKIGPVCRQINGLYQQLKIKLYQGLVKNYKQLE